MDQSSSITTLEDVLRLLDGASLNPTRRRDMVSAVKRVCEMAGTTPAAVPAEPTFLRGMLSAIRPAAHGISAKSYSNLRSLLAAALQLAGVVDPLGRGDARRHPVWAPLLEAIADDKRLSNGLAAFANWCAGSRDLPQPRSMTCRPAIPDLAGGQDALPEATRPRAPRPQCLERGQRKDHILAKPSSSPPSPSGRLPSISHG